MFPGNTQQFLLPTHALAPKQISERDTDFEIRLLIHKESLHSTMYKAGCQAQAVLGNGLSGNPE